MKTPKEWCAIYKLEEFSPYGEFDAIAIKLIQEDALKSAAQLVVNGLNTPELSVNDAQLIRRLRDNILELIN